MGDFSVAGLLGAIPFGNASGAPSDDASPSLDDALRALGIPAPQSGPGSPSAGPSPPQQGLLPIPPDPPDLGLLSGLDPETQSRLIRNPASMTSQLNAGMQPPQGPPQGALGPGSQLPRPALPQMPPQQGAAPIGDTLAAGAPQRGQPPASPGAGPTPNLQQGSVPQMTPAPTMGPRNHFGDVLDELFTGGSFQRAAQNEYREAMAAWASRNAAAYANSLPSNQRAAFMADPQGFMAQYVQNFAPATLKGGETRTYTNGAPAYSAPAYGYDPTTRRGYSIAPGNLNNVGAQQPMQESAVVPAGSHPHLITTGGADGGYGAGPPGSAPPGYPNTGPPPDAPMVQPSAAPGAQPRGMRNNNPGNVMALPAGQMWQGQTGVDPQGYAQFDTIANGARASLMNLHSYATKHGINTVAGVVNRWAPAAAGNDPASYAQFVAQRLGVGPNDKIDLTDPTTLTSTARALFDFENGPAATQGAFQGPPPGALPPGASAPAAGLPTGRNPRDVDLTPGAPSGSRPMTAAERQQWGVAPGAVAAIDAKGDPVIVQAPEFGAKEFGGVVKDLQDSRELENYNKSLGFYSTAAQAAQRPGGLPDTQLTDLAAQQFSGGVARKFNADMIQNAQGPLGRLKAFIPQLVSGQRYTPAMRQALLTAMHDHAQESSDALDRLTASKQALVQPYGGDLGPIASRLKRAIPDVPDLSKIPNGMNGGGGSGSYQPGQVVPGRGGIRYQFLGGDATNPNSWKAVK